jgi:type IV secretion system protein VirD4
LVKDPGHYLAFGATRSGKNTDLITPMLMVYRGSMLVLDPKGENAFLTAQRRRDMGQQVIILDPWNEVNRRYGAKAKVRETCSRFNPLAHLNARSPDFADDIAAIAEGVVIGGGNDPHWTDSARELISGLIAAIVEDSPGVASFADVRKLLTATDAELAQKITAICEKNPNSLAGRKLRRFAKDSREVASIRSTGETQTAILDSARLLAAMETDRNAFRLDELATRRTTLYLVLPVDRLQSYGRWMRLIISLAIQAISRQNTPPDPPVMFLLDELGTINPGGGLQMIAQAMGLMAGMGIRIAAFFQDLNQLQTDYPKQWQSFIANSAIIQLLRVNDLQTAEYFSRYIGTKTAAYNANTAHGRAVIMPDELMRLPRNETIILNSGGPYLRLRKVPYFKDARWNGMYRPNPLFPASAQPEQPRPWTPPGPPGGDRPPVDPVDWNKVAARWKAAGTTAAAKVKAWVASKAKQKRQARADQARENTSTAERERWIRTLRDAE